MFSRSSLIARRILTYNILSPRLCTSQISSLDPPEQSSTTNSEFCYSNPSTVSSSSISSCQSSKTNSDFSYVKETIFNASIIHVHQHGWTLPSLHHGIQSLNLPPSTIGLFTEYELVHFFMNSCNKQLKEILEPNMGIDDAIKMRLEMNIPYISSGRWKEAIAFGILYPSNACLTVKQLESTINIIVNNNNPRLGRIERELVKLIYILTELHLLQDESDYYENSWIFLKDYMRKFECLLQGSLTTGYLDRLLVHGIMLRSLGEGIISLLVPSNKLQWIFSNMKGYSIPSSENTLKMKNKEKKWFD